MYWTLHMTKYLIVHRVQFEKCQIYMMAKNIVYGWTFPGVRFHTRLKKTSPSVQCVLITTLSAIPEYVHPLNSKQYREKQLSKNEKIVRL